jgi:hypothetical protein
MDNVLGLGPRRAERNTVLGQRRGEPGTLSVESILGSKYTSQGSGNRITICENAARQAAEGRL